MHTLPKLLLGILLCAASLPGATDGMPPIPDDYPSHLNVGECSQDKLEEKLQHYNETRLALSEVLRHMADDQAMQPSARARLIGYAEHLEDMRKHLPPPDPDSNEFRNFDFQLGMTLTSMAVFLNTEDTDLAERFTTDREDPGSELGMYLARLEGSRQHYMQGLDQASQQPECGDPARS